MRQAVFIAVLLVSASSLAFGISKSYDVVPYGNCVAEIVTAPNNGITQYYRNTLDSLSSISVWIGDTFDTVSFNVDVVDSASPSNVIAYGYGVHPHKNWSWVDFPLTKQADPVRGRTYRVTVKQQDGGPISFAYDPTNPYRYGKAVANGSSPSLPETADLALRVVGLHDPVSDVWRAVTNHGYDPPRGGAGDTTLAKAESMGVKWLRDMFRGWHGWEVDPEDVKGIYRWYDSTRWNQGSGFSMVGILCFGSSDTAKSTCGSDTEYATSYPPRHLWPEDSSQVNYWAQYCHDIMVALPKVKYWCVWPEMNAWWYWLDPDTLYYKDPNGGPIDTPRDRCSLYVRMCRVAESTARVLGGSPRRKIVGGETARLIEPTGGATGVEWLEWMFDIAKKDYGAAESCFDIVSVHPYIFYDWPNHFREDVFQTNLDTARWVMRQAGLSGMELWATEYGWPRWWVTRLTDSTADTVLKTDTLVQANNICKFYTSAIARQADPRGGYDRAIHYELTSHHSPQNTDNNGFGLLESLDSQPLVPAGWAFAQESLLTGKRLNGRVMTGDSMVRVYEFENPADSLKTWVCWRSDGGTQEATVQLPARTDSGYIEMLAYREGTPPNDMRQVNSGTGWLTVGGLGERPQFVTEPASMPISRPDLVVDRILIPAGAKVGSVMDIHAIVKNIGNDTTPDTVALDFLCDDSVFRHATSEWPIAPGDSYDFSFEINPIPYWMHGWHLFSARVNPGQTYVEKDGMDDNCGYARRYISYAPGGDIRGVVCGGHSNAPLPLFALETHSYEAETLGSVPCESARLVQWAYGNDTIVDGGDTTDWFCVSQAVSLDTSWLYLSGQSKYKFFLQVKDSWSMSDLIPDTTHPFVVFDTTGPTGSILINGGARFTPSSTCTLRLAAVDSASGVAAMRFINVPKVDLVVGGSFTATAGSWQHENSEVDTLLHMARLSVASIEARVRQFIPAESISAHAGDSCALEASILAHVHEDDATGGVSFWLYSIREDSFNFHDTLWELVDSACYSGELLSLTGRYGLSKHFLLEEPTPESGWVWRGGMVKVEASAENGSGDAWVDNVRLQPYEPDSGYFWWGNYDTLAVWDVGSGAGVKAVQALFMDSAGMSNATPYADTVILDPTAPVVSISVPDPGQLVSGTLQITGWSYDPVEVAGDTWFAARHLFYRSVDSTEWLPVSPDSVSYEPAYPDSGSILGPAVHLGYWNTDSVADGEHYVLLTGTDSAGHAASCTTWVIVSNSGGGGDFCGGPEGGGSGMGEGSCYIGSATGHVLHVSDDLALLDTFAVADSGSEANVTAVLEVGNDSLLVLDAANKRVHKLHRSGQHRRRLVSGLSQPTDLKRDANGNFWLADRGWHRIGKFRSNGTLVFVRGGLGADSIHFHSPEGIAVKGSLVYVADGGNNRIAVWDTSGNFKTTITGDFENPTAVWVTESGTIYLTDGSDGKLKGITPLGGNIVAIGTTDSSKLKGLVSSENRHSLFSLASVPNRVYKLRIQSDESIPGGQQSAGKVNLPKTLNLAQPFPNPARSRLNIAYALPHQTRVVLKLYDVAGKLVTTIVNGEQKPGYYNLTWNRQDTKGRSVACGVYFCTLTAENQRFCRKVVLAE